MTQHFSISLLRRLSAFFVFTFVLISACSKSGSDETSPEATLISNLTYTPAVLELKSGVAGSSAKPSKSGTTPATYSISTSPSSGGNITIDADGVITASASLAIGEYKVSVTATNTAGAATFSNAYTVKVTPNNTAPSALSYSPNTLTLTFGNSGSSATPTITSSSAVTYSLSTSPTNSNIIINAQGVIAASASLPVGTYQVSVTATNSIGSTTFPNVYTVKVNAASTASTFNTSVKAIIQNNCGGCHGSGGPRANYTDYTTAKNNIDRILTRINLASGASGMMPQGGPKLQQTTIDQIQKWKDDGLLE